MPVLRGAGIFVLIHGTSLALYTVKTEVIMQDVQNIPNPDVNSVNTSDDFGSHEGHEQSPNATEGNLGKGYGKDAPAPEPVVPPDEQPVVPIEDPPGSNEPPVGDVDDSPKKIAAGE
jgi:hypothetical protein